MNLNLHPDDYLIYMKALLLAREGAAHFGLRLQALEPFPKGTLETEYERGVYGRCYGTGLIHIAFRYTTAEGKWLGRLPEHEIFDTVAHELAHLRYMNHGDGFKKFYREIKQWIDARR